MRESRYWRCRKSADALEQDAEAPSDNAAPITNMSNQVPLSSLLPHPAITKINSNSI